MRPSVIIIDDEHYSRRRIRRFLEDYDVDLAGEYVERSDAVDAIRSLSPDLTFLDVRLRSATGFDVLADIDEHDLPVTIFTTAYDEYAVRAFEVHAVDYLLKPFDRDRFRIAMKRALAWIARHELPPSLRSLAADLRATAPNGHNALRWIRARRPDQSSVIIETRDIHWIEAAGNYVYLHTSEGRFAHRQPLGQLIEQLDPEQFARVHRSAIVNVDCIQHIAPWVGGDCHIRLKSGAELRMSRHYRRSFDRALQHG